MASLNQNIENNPMQSRIAACGAALWRPGACRRRSPRNTRPRRQQPPSWSTVSGVGSPP